MKILYLAVLELLIYALRLVAIGLAGATIIGFAELVEKFL